jgi:hypothetical protein
MGTQVPDLGQVADGTKDLQGFPTAQTLHQRLWDKVSGSNNPMETSNIFWKFLVTSSTFSEK